MQRSSIGSPRAVSGLPAAYLWPPNYYTFTMCFGWVGTCIPRLVSMLTIHRRRVSGSLPAASAVFNFNFHFWSSSHIDILPAVGAWIAWKWRVPSSLKSGQWKQEWTEKIALILPPTSTRPMCLLCQETIAVMKISNLKRHYGILKRHFLKIQR